MLMPCSLVADGILPLSWAGTARGDLEPAMVARLALSMGAVRRTCGCWAATLRLQRLRAKSETRARNGFVDCIGENLGENFIMGPNGVTS